MNLIPTIAIVGRTNVGKSTLFNRLAGRRLAIVEDTPGVTRDRSYAFIDRHNRKFTLIDTGGLIGEEEHDFSAAVRAQAELAIAEADIVIAIFDGRVGLHPQDQDVVAILRRSAKPVYWVINKCEQPAAKTGAIEFYQLGIDHFFCVSALHGDGVSDLLDAIFAELTPTKEHPDTPINSENQAVRLAILGKPNVGKSTLINRLLGEQRLITSTIAGTTRDSITIPITRLGQRFLLMDTAGLRRKSKINNQSVERFSTLRAIQALAGCDVALLLLDASDGPPAEQDAKIAKLVHERGKALVIVVNKWDAVEKDHRSAKLYQDSLSDVLRFVSYAPVVFVSALTGRRCPSIWTKVQEVYTASSTRVQTAELNRVLTQAVIRHTPAAHRGKQVKLYFGTQTGVNPPTFVLFCNHPKGISSSYQRYIKNSIRAAFGFEGTDLKLLVRKRRSQDEQATANS